ncbi:hypothetical protein [Streptomyces adustus]
MTATACRPDCTGAAGPASAPSATAPAAASDGPAPVGSADPACTGDRGHVDVRPYAHTIAQDVILPAVQEGRWTTSGPSSTGSTARPDGRAVRSTSATGQDADGTIVRLDQRGKP